VKRNLDDMARLEEVGNFVVVSGRWFRGRIGDYAVGGRYLSPGDVRMSARRFEPRESIGSDMTRGPGVSLVRKRVVF